MEIHLPKHWKNRLARLPETSMGAQHIDIYLRDGRIIEDVPVFNGEVCETPEPFEPNDIAEIRISPSTNERETQGLM